MVDDTDSQNPEIPRDILQEYLELGKALQKKTKESAFELFKPWPKQMDFLSSRARVKALIAGNRCLAGSQMIVDAVSGIERRVDEINDDFFVWAWDGHKRIVAKANRPFRKKIQSDLWKLTFSDGTTISCSSEHLLLGQNGWISAIDAIALPEFSACRLPSTLDSDQSARVLDAVNSIQKALDSQSCCQPYPHCDDEQPHRLSESFRDVQTSLGDVLEHTLAPCQDHISSPLDAQVSKPEHIHRNLDVYLHSNLDDLLRFSDLCVGMEHQAFSEFHIPVWDLCPEQSLSLDGFYQLHEDLSKSRKSDLYHSACEKAVSQNANQDIDTTRQPHEPGRQDSCLLSTSGDHRQESSSLGRIHQSDICSGLIQTAISPFVITSHVSIVRLDYLGKGDVWDFTVENYHNYIIGNVANHNTGKTECATYEVCCHLTGKYPEWWRGIKYHGPVIVWVVGKSIEWVRDKLQKKFFGGLEEPWSGWLKESDVIKVVNKAGMPMAIDVAIIKNVNGGSSILKYLSYDQDPDKFTGDTVDLILLDEEPPDGLFGQCKARTIQRKGHILFTFTPEHGQTPLYMQLMEDDAVDKFHMSVKDAKHLDYEDVCREYASLPEHERIARMEGIALQGDGAVFPFPQEMYVCDSFQIPSYWPRIGGLDIGLAHPTAAVALAIDRDSGCVYAYQEYSVKGKSPKEHAWALKPWGIKFALSHDAFSRNYQTKVTDASVFEDNGLHVFRAQNSVDAFILKARDMITSGKLWIFKDRCSTLVKQMMLYHYKEVSGGNVMENIYKYNDDTVDAFKYGLMGIDKAHYKGEYDNMRRSTPQKPFKPASPYGY